MEYVVKKGFFYGKKKDRYNIGDVLEETELYEDRLPYFVKIGMLAKRPIVLDVEVKTKADAEAKAKAEAAAKALAEAKAKAAKAKAKADAKAAAKAAAKAEANDIL
jgi:hypothetical protein